MSLIFERSIPEIDDTAKVADELSSLFSEGDTIALIGDLGTGKTTFTQMICKMWNITDVDSPSFALINEYYGSKKVFHFDFYRIEEMTELFDFGFHEYISDVDAIKFVEWADMFPEVLPRKKYEMKFSFDENGNRQVAVHKYE